MEPTHPQPPATAKRMEDMTEEELYAEIAEAVWQDVTTYRRGIDCLREIFKRAGWPVPETSE